MRLGPHLRTPNPRLTRGSHPPHLIGFWRPEMWALQNFQGPERTKHFHCAPVWIHRERYCAILSQESLNLEIKKKLAFGARIFSESVHAARSYTDGQGLTEVIMTLNYP
jgi:hypothetical protein